MEAQYPSEYWNKLYNSSVYYTLLKYRIRKLIVSVLFLSASSWMGINWLPEASSSSVYISNSVPTSQKTTRLATRFYSKYQMLVLFTDKKLLPISVIVRKHLVYSGKKLILRLLLVVVSIVTTLVSRVQTSMIWHSRRWPGYSKYVERCNSPPLSEYGYDILTFPSAVRQMPRYTSQRRGTAHTLP